ncbi:hypothetical protein Barb6XT_02500 [Bacteroidales bacterium Barb6XT]|nr:hypothetical protein Barb6XT_02500 [Bacteroidales bacterium Barb6XT]
MGYTIIMVPEWQELWEQSKQKGDGDYMKVPVCHYDMIKVLLEKSNRLEDEAKLLKDEIERIKEVIRQKDIFRQHEAPKKAIRVTMKCRK